MATSTEVMAAVKRKLNITWEDEGTEARVGDVVASVTPRLNSLLGNDADHEFGSGDASWGLFLNGCLYEFSDAWDDFTTNYEREIQSVRLLGMANAQA